MKATEGPDVAERPTKRDQIIEAAGRCFYGQGIAATGVDAIAEAAGVSKRTLYNHFASKDELVLAYVTWRDARWQEEIARRLESLTDPVERVLAYFDGYFAVPDREGFRGCSLINAAAEMADDDGPVLRSLQDHKRRVHAELAGLVADTGVADPATAATTLALLLEGAIALFGVHRDVTGVEQAKQAARRVLVPTA